MIVITVPSQEDLDEFLGIVGRHAVHQDMDPLARARSGIQDCIKDLPPSDMLTLFESFIQDVRRNRGTAPVSLDLPADIVPKPVLHPGNFHQPSAEKTQVHHTSKNPFLDYDGGLQLEFSVPSPKAPVFFSGFHTSVGVTASWISRNAIYFCGISVQSTAPIGQQETISIATSWISGSTAFVPTSWHAEPAAVSATATRVPGNTVLISAISCLPPASWICSSAVDAVSEDNFLLRRQQGRQLSTVEE